MELFFYHHTSLSAEIIVISVSALIALLEPRPQLTQLQFPALIRDERRQEVTRLHVSGATRRGAAS